MCIIEWLNSYFGVISSIATVVIAVFAVITACLTRSLANDNRLMRMAGTKPKVVIYLAAGSQREHAVNLVLANVGRGPARNVEFTIRGDSHDFETHGVSSVLVGPSNGMGVDFLPQGERIQSFFGWGPSLLGPPPLSCFSVSITFEDLNGRVHQANYQLDVEKLGWISWLKRSNE